jgi:N-acetyl-anhydromuramyl-L-alanine amidase AmpD
MAIPFVEARWYTKTDGRKVDLVVIHSMEVAEKPTTAEGVARMFATTLRKASAHYCSDDNSTVQCVREKDVAYAAPGANHNGIHFELAGFAAQSAAQWKDAFSSQMLREQVGPLVAKVCTRYKVPVRFVTAAGLVRGERGITDHDEVSKAFRRSTHWDPGPNFPMESFLAIVRAHQTQEDDVTIEELDAYLASDKGQRRIQTAVTHVLRVATGPDDGSVPASRWFDSVKTGIVELLGRTRPPGEG